MADTKPLNGNDGGEDEDLENGEDAGDDGDDDPEEAIHDIITAGRSAKDILQGFTDAAFQTTDQPIVGDIYRAWAFGLAGEGPTLTIANGSIFVSQVIAPVIIVVYAVHQLDFSEKKFFDVVFNFEDFNDGLSTALTKVLAALLLFGFLINEALIVTGERMTFVKLRIMAKAILQVNPNAGKDLNTGYLTLGTFVNAMSSILMCFATFFLMLMAVADKSPLDVVMNILGLQFLRQLDDMDGPMGFLGELPWDALAMCKAYYALYNNTCRDGPVMNTGDVDFDVLTPKIINRYKSILHDIWYYTVFFMAVAGPVIFLIIHVDTKTSDEEVLISEVNDKLTSNITALAAELAEVKSKLKWV